MKVAFNARMFRQLIAGALLVGGLTAAVQAEESTTVNKVVTPAAVNLTSADAFTLSSLGATLEDMGYEITPEGTENVTAYNVKFNESNISGSVRVAISPDQSTLWATIFLLTLEPGQTAPADLAARMLDANSENGTCYFYSSLYEGKRYVYIACPVANRNITKPQLRKTISTLVQSTAKNEHLWNAAKWDKATTLVKE
jgi:hypothetical protein